MKTRTGNKEKMGKKKSKKSKKKKSHKGTKKNGSMRVRDDAIRLSDVSETYCFVKETRNCKRSLRILGQRLVLAPYDSCHVPIVNKWLKDDWIREVVSAKKLSLEKEYEQQKMWAVDETKFSFIVCRRKDRNSSGSNDIKCQYIGTVDLFIDTEYAEIIIMIADRQHRRKGLAREAVSLAVRCAFLSRITSSRAYNIISI